VEVARKSYEISTARFEAGNITSFDLSQTQLRLTDAQTNSLNALIDYKLAIADLKRKTFFDYERQ
jgi:outer membrane protein TolC